MATACVYHPTSYPPYCGCAIDPSQNYNGQPQSPYSNGYDAYGYHQQHFPPQSHYQNNSGAVDPIPFATIQNQQLDLSGQQWPHQEQQNGIYGGQTGYGPGPNVSQTLYYGQQQQQQQQQAQSLYQSQSLQPSSQYLNTSTSHNPPTSLYQNSSLTTATRTTASAPSSSPTSAAITPSPAPASTHHHSRMNAVKFTTEIGSFLAGVVSAGIAVFDEVRK